MEEETDGLLVAVHGVRGQLSEQVHLASVRLRMFVWLVRYTHKGTVLVEVIVAQPLA